MPKILSCVNLKGGVGKTALAVNLAAIAGDIHDLKTLLIDVDPQTNATFSCIGVDAWEKWDQDNGTIADLFELRNHKSADGHEKQAQDVIVKDVFKNVDLLPSHLDLFSCDLELGARIRREEILVKKLGKALEPYDLVICDCPPNLTLPTLNALSISTYYLVPVTLDFLSALGIGLLISKIEEFGQEIGKEFTSAGIVITRIGRPARHREETEETIRSTFGDLVLRNTITERSDVSESASVHQPVHIFGNDDCQKEFKAVSKEILQTIEII